MTLNKRQINLLIQIFGRGVRAICASNGAGGGSATAHIQIMEEMIENSRENKWSIEKGKLSVQPVEVLKRWKRSA